MKKILRWFILSTFAVGSLGWAQDDMRGVTERPMSEVEPKVFDRAVNISARVGALGFRDANSNYSSRIVEGVTLNWNVPRTMAFEGTGIVAGLESGLLFSHIGSPGATFLGTNSPSGALAGSNAFLVPLNLSLGYKPTDNTMVALIGGANVIYRSSSAAMQFGRASDANGTGSSTEFFPGVGLNAGWELGKTVALSLRGDAIPTPTAVMFTGTLGAVFPLV